jgi:integrase
MPQAPRSLKLSEWPALDREAWARACKPGARLRRGGAASHLKPVTRDDLAKRYGLFLDFLLRTRRLDNHAAAGAQVTCENVDAFIAELRARVSSVTLYGSIYKLRRVTEIIAPNLDLAWLREIENDLAFAMQPRSKMNRLVLAEALVEAGLTLMAEAEAYARTPLQRATMYRNGLMVALLACCPIRLKNFAALTLGKSLRVIDESWWIVLAATETKEARADERRVPDFLDANMERYRSHYRSILGRSDNAPGGFWLSSNDGRPLCYLGVEAIIMSTTETATGVCVSPHLFRSSAATTAAIHAGTTPYLASALLDHRDSKTTQEHYNRASSLSAGKEYGNIVQMYRTASTK